MRLIVETDGVNYKILEADGKKLIGECLRCGECCSSNKNKCKNLLYETVDNVKVARCVVYSSRPVSCALFPLPINIDQCRRNAFKYI